jgi:hypothetical protein
MTPADVAGVVRRRHGRRLTAPLAQDQVATLAPLHAELAAHQPVPARVFRRRNEPPQPGAATLAFRCPAARSASAGSRKKEDCSPATASRSRTPSPSKASDK